MKTLIYEQDENNINLLKYACKQYEIESCEVKDKEKAYEVLGNEKIDFLFLNCNMEKLELNEETKCVIIGDPDKSQALNIFRYNPFDVLVNPFTLSDVSLVITKLLGKFTETTNYASLTLNVYHLLKEINCKLISMNNNGSYSMNIKESLESYCKNYCPLAKTSYDVGDENKNYQLLYLFTEKRGTVFCDRKEKCELWAFYKWLEKEDDKLLSETPIDIVHKPVGDVEIGLKKLLDEFISTYNNRLSTIYKWKYDYCTKTCGQAKEDTNFEKSNNIFKMKKDSFSYCQRSDCPLDDFFVVFKRLVL